MTMRIAVYVRELMQQSRLATIGVQMLNTQLTAPPMDPEADYLTNREASQASMDYALTGVQTLLTAAAQISKLLWADTQQGWPDERRQFALDRASRLREIVRPSSLLQRRAVRNSIEHMDERLDNFMASDTNAALVTFVMAPGGYVTSTVGMTTLRYLYTDRLSFQALDDEVSFQALIDAIKEVERRAHEWIGVPGNEWT